MSEPVVLDRNSADDERLQAVLAAFRLGYLAGVEDAAAPAEVVATSMRLSSQSGDSR